MSLIIVSLIMSGLCASPGLGLGAVQGEVACIAYIASGARQANLSGQDPLAQTLQHLSIAIELHYILDCPRLNAIRNSIPTCFRMLQTRYTHLLVQHKDRQAVSYCLTAIQQMAQT